jgi:hypothetical protein
VTAVRLALPLLAALVLIVPVACGGKDDEQTAEPPPLTLQQQLLTAEDAPGSKPDPVEKGGTTADFDEFIKILNDVAIDPDPTEMTAVFKKADFKGAGSSTRFFGQTHTRTAPHLFNYVIQLQSEDGATSALDWLEADTMKPCPMDCAVQRSKFDVEDIPGARGVHRSATAEDIARVGTKDERPIDLYWVGFTDGSSVYSVTLQGQPGTVSEEQALKIASAYYERIAGN